MLAFSTLSAWVGLTALVAAALRHVKDLPSCACAKCAVLRLLQYLRLVTVVSCEHLANRYLQDRSGPARKNSFFGNGSLDSRFAAVIGTTLGVRTCPAPG